MSLQTYNQPIYFDDRKITYNKLTGESSAVEAITTKNGVAMEFQANLKILSGNDKYLVRATTYTIVGGRDTAIGANDVASALMGLLEAGARFASNLAYCSKGVIVGFFAKLGKYRQDEMPMSVPTGDNSWASLILNNNDSSGYGSDPCERNSVMPVEPASSSVRIPWFRDDLSRQDVKESLDDWAYTDSTTGIKYSLGKVRFKDDDQIDMICYRTSNLQRLKVAEYSRMLGGIKANNDTVIGIQTDKVLSEKYNNVNENAGDDDGIIVEPDPEP